MRKMRTWLAVPVLMAAIVVPTTAMTGQPANAAPRANVVSPDYTCPAASTTAPACLYAESNFNDDVGPYGPNTGYLQPLFYVYGIRNRNTHYYLCFYNSETGKTGHLNPAGQSGSENPNVKLDGYDYFIELWFHGNSTCTS